MTSDSAPPPVPKKGMPTWAIVLIVVGGVGLLVFGIGVVTTVAVVVPKMQENQRKLTCMNNLSQLGQVYLVAAHENRRKAQARSGAAMWLGFRKNGLLGGDAKVLLCPGDASAAPPESLQDGKRYADVDLAHVPRDLCSYAGRDFDKFPLDSIGRQPIGACLSHRHGAVVVFESGDAQFMSLEDLGFSSDEEKTVGPDSKSPILRVLRYGDGIVR